MVVNINILYPRVRNQDSLRGLIESQFNFAKNYGYFELVVYFGGVYLPFMLQLLWAQDQEDIKSLCLICMAFITFFLIIDL